MSDEGQPPESPEDALRSLTSLDFGPAWARGGGESKTGGADPKEKHRRDEREDGHRGKGRGGERRRDGERREGGRRDDQRGEKRDGGKGRRFDNRDRERGDRGDRRDRGDRYQKGGRGRRDDDRGRPQRVETPPPEGITANVMPVEEGLDGLAKEILAGGRTYSVFDLAKLVLGARERFNVNFKSAREGGLIRCKRDGALWLTKEEALRHFHRAEWRKDYYEEVVTDADPPKGNFQTIARCGISGEWLGPPNYHGYQPAIAQLHRERFGHMSLDAYKRKIRMERGEEAVNAWLETMSKRVRYRPTGGVVAEAKAEKGAEEGKDQPASAEEEFSAGDDPVAGSEESGPEEAAGAVAETPEDPSATDSPDEAASAEEAAEEQGETSEEEAGEVQPQPAAVQSKEPLLHDARDVERHFLEHHFEDVFQITNRAWVSGNIPGNHLSPGLLTLLRETVAEERRYPGKLTPMLCRQLSGRHVAVFKWRRKLKAGPSRPHPVPDDITIADRPRALLNWITDNSGKKLEFLWQHFLPQKVSDQEKLGWYHDLHWLLNQGYVILMADSTIHLAKKPSGELGDERKAPQPATDGPSPPAPQAAPAPAPAPPATTAESAPEAPERRGSAGLYALNSRTLAGSPKSFDALSGRGLWPSLARWEASWEDETEDEEEEEVW